MLPYFLYQAAQAVLVLMMVPFLVVKISKLTCGYLAVGTLMVAAIGFLADAPLLQIVGYFVLSLVFGLVAYIIWWSSKGLLFIFAQLWRRGE